MVVKREWAKNIDEALASAVKMLNFVHVFDLFPLDDHLGFIYIEARKVYKSQLLIKGVLSI